MEPLPLVLVTNDDGIGAPGLLAAAETASEFGTPLVVAPAADQTGMARAYGRLQGTGAISRYTRSIRGQELVVYSVVGSPAETVAHAVLELADRRPALCIAGINAGANVGLALGISGTIGAAMEADSLGIPAIAVSIERGPTVVASREYVPEEWAVARAHLARFARAVLERGLPGSTAVLNLNIPMGASETTAARRTCQAQQNVFEPVAPGREVRTEPHRLAIRTSIEAERLLPDDDVRAVFHDRVVSYTLLRRSMTDDAPWQDPTGG